MAAKNMNSKEFYEAMEQGKEVLVDYWAPWCSYCRRIAPAYEKVAQQYGSNLVIAQINIDEEPLLAHKEQIEVIPTLVLYRRPGGGLHCGTGIQGADRCVFAGKPINRWSYGKGL